MKSSTDWRPRVLFRHVNRLARVAVVAAAVAPLSWTGASSASAVTITPAPHITALVPVTAVRGATIAVIGTNLRSSNGVVYATFGPYGTYTRCPLVTRCNVLVPKYIFGRYQVRIHTQTGVSNFLTFTYK